MMVLPTSYALSSSSLEIGRQPAASGGSGDNYEGSLNGSRVCVKRVRVYAKGDPKKAARVHRYLTVSPSPITNKSRRLCTKKP